MMMLKKTGTSNPGNDDATAAPGWREAPHNIDVEQALLGAMLVNNGVVERLDGIVDPEDFFDPLHHEIFDTVVALVRSGKPANPVTLRTFFDNAAPISPHMTVPQYLGRLAVNATTIINALEYARTVHDLALRRRLIGLGTDIVNSAYDDAARNPVDLIEGVEKDLAALAERHGGGDEAAAFGVALDESLARIEAGFKRGGALPGLSSGLADLDRIIGGFEDDCLYIGAGRPGIGKTGFVIGVAWQLAARGTPVDFYSLEMPRYQIAARILARETGLAGDALRRGDITEAQHRLLMETRQRIAKAPLLIDHRGGISIGQLMARARRQHRRHGTKMVIVDYLQLLSGSGTRRSDNRVNELTEITTGLKALAKELHVPVLALSQLSRAVETRENKRPMLSDLRESGSIEQDADAVMMLYREEYYVSKAMPAETDIAKYLEWQSTMARVRGKAEIVIPKNRSGPEGIVELAFDGPTTTFSNLARDGMAGSYHD